MYLLDVEALDLGPDVKAIGLDLVEADENREPVRGEPAARIWSRVLPAVAGTEPWALDFFSHLDRVRDYCRMHDIDFREANKRSITISAPKPNALEPLIGRFQSETFGVRAGKLLEEGDMCWRANWPVAARTLIKLRIRIITSVASAHSRMARWFC